MMTKLKAISKGSFQISPDYVLLEISSASSRSLRIQERSNFTHVVRSQSGGGTKLVCNETANLLTSLKEGGSVPINLLTSKGLCTTLARLVLDDVLRIFWDGQFVGGPSAWAALYEGQPHSTCNLSTDALRYAQALHLKDVIKLSRRLYAYNSVPVTCFWRKCFPDSIAIIKFLGSTAEKYLIQNRGWLAWQAKDWQLQADQPLYKLYLSPQIIALQECWQRAFPVFIESKAVGLKIGADVYGLLRPDKIVAHFESQEALMETAKVLREVLGGFPSQGVPFAAALDQAGLLSWGTDLPLVNRESWRSWLTDHLAAAIVSASEADLPIEPWQYAMERLHLEGVNIQDWKPMPELLQ